VREPATFVIGRDGRSWRGSPSGNLATPRERADYEKALSDLS